VNAPEFSGAFFFNNPQRGSKCGQGTTERIIVFPVRVNQTEELAMDKDRVAGGVKKVTGKIKEQAGKALGDAGTEAEGKSDQAEGRVQGAVGHAKDAVREIAGKK
jgi:uncharacterized protein YjbJ (UPF0337 family)